MNDTFTVLFVCNSFEKVDGYLDVLVCDDFKVYFNTKVSELMGLKISQHTRKTRRGPVLHEMVHSATGLIIAIYFEMKYNSPVASTVTMIKNTLLKM